MSTADELTKLNDLRVKGVISQAEFDKQKASLLDPPRVSKRGSGAGWKIVVGAVGAIGLFVGLVGGFNKGVVALPTVSGWPSHPEAESASGPRHSTRVPEVRQQLVDAAGWV